MASSDPWEGRHGNRKLLPGSVPVHAWIVLTALLVVSLAGPVRADSLKTFGEIQSGDFDGDGIRDNIDNAPGVANSDQTNLDTPGTYENGYAHGNFFGPRKSAGGTKVKAVKMRFLARLEVTAPVPEPGTIALFSVGALGVLAWRRRRARR